MVVSRRRRNRAADVDADRQAHGVDACGLVSNSQPQPWHGLQSGTAQPRLHQGIHLSVWCWRKPRPQVGRLVHPVPPDELARDVQLRKELGKRGLAGPRVGPPPPRVSPCARATTPSGTAAGRGRWARGWRAGPTGAVRRRWCERLASNALRTAGGWGLQTHDPHAGYVRQPDQDPDRAVFARQHTDDRGRLGRMSQDLLTQ